MKSACPKCGKRHNKFPRECYYAVHTDHAHCVIAKLASLGNSTQQAWSKETELTWKAMSEYAELNFPDDINISS